MGKMWNLRGLLTAVLLGSGLTKSELATKASEENRKMLFDFRSASNVNDWTEISDTVREVGMSKAVLTLQKTQLFQRAIFFTLLNPQANGAGFAGARTATRLNLSGYRAIEISCRAQGANENYKIVLGHRGTSVDSDVSYEQFFSVSTSNANFGIVRLDLSEFKPYFRGREVPDREPLDIADITSFGIQIYGGVYSQVKQKGVSSLEIEYVAASR